MSNVFKKNLLASDALIQVPFIKVTIGSYTFGVYNKTTVDKMNENGFYSGNPDVYTKYPNYVSQLDITKINGQVNQYTLQLKYPVGMTDDPNFFEKVFSSVSGSRKIVFSYGDANRPSYVYKDEEAVITDVKQSFNFGNNGQATSVITYTISAVSSCALGASGTGTHMKPSKPVKPSDEIKKLLFYNNKTSNTEQKGLGDIFYGMTPDNFSMLVDGSDKAVELDSKVNISDLEYLQYLVTCMVPVGSPDNEVIGTDCYVLTIHDDTSYDRLYHTSEITGPYFEIKKTSYLTEHSDAYEIDIGFSTSTLVLNFQVDNNQVYSMYYDYQAKLNDEKYARRLVNGRWEDVFAPVISSKNDNFSTGEDDINWWTQVTKFPISASITLQGLLRPATLMQYVRLNVIFPGGHKHITSGLYIVTKQTDSLGSAGYRTVLNLTKISGDLDLTKN